MRGRGHGTTHASVRSLARAGSVSVRVLISKWTGVAVYLVSMAGLSVLCANLSCHVTTHAIALASPYFPDDGPRQLSLLERRQIDAAQAAKPFPRLAEVALTVPSIWPQILAARLDIAEKEHKASLPTCPLQLETQCATSRAVGCGRIRPKLRCLQRGLTLSWG